MTIETAFPEDWTIGQALATRALLQQARLTATPIIAFIRERRYGQQIQEIRDRVKEPIREAARDQPRRSRWRVPREPWPRSPPVTDARYGLVPRLSCADGAD